MTTENIDKLLEKRRKLDEQIRAKRARIRAKQSKKNRKEETRRKIITGALALEHAAQNPNSDFARTLQRLLTQYVKPTDRQLFELPEEDSASQQAAPPPANTNTTEETAKASPRLARLFGRDGE